MPPVLTDGGLFFKAAYTIMKKLLCLLFLSFSFGFGQAAPDVAKTVEIGSSVKIGFVSSDGTPPFTFQWQKNGVNIPGATAAILDLGATTQNSAGTYTLIVSNPKGSTTTNKGNLSITITIAPSNAVAAFL